MPREKSNKKNDLNLITPSNKKKIFFFVWLGGVIAIFILMMALKKSAENMITHAADRPNAIQAILKGCTSEKEKRGLKNAEGIAFLNDCNKQGIEKLDAKK